MPSVVHVKFQYLGTWNRFILSIRGIDQFSLLCKRVQALLSIDGVEYEVPQMWWNDGETFNKLGDETDLDAAVAFAQQQAELKCCIPCIYVRFGNGHYYGKHAYPLARGNDPHVVRDFYPYTDRDVHHYATCHSNGLMGSHPLRPLNDVALLLAKPTDYDKEAALRDLDASLSAASLKNLSSSFAAEFEQAQRRADGIDQPEEKLPEKPGKVLEELECVHREENYVPNLQSIFDARWASEGTVEDRMKTTLVVCGLTEYYTKSGELLKSLIERILHSFFHSFSRLVVSIPRDRNGCCKDYMFIDLGNKKEADRAYSVLSEFRFYTEQKLRVYHAWAALDDENSLELSKSDVLEGEDYLDYRAFLAGLVEPIKKEEKKGETLSGEPIKEALSDEEEKKLMEEAEQEKQLRRKGQSVVLFNIPDEYRKNIPQLEYIIERAHYTCTEQMLIPVDEGGVAKDFVLIEFTCVRFADKGLQALERFRFCNGSQFEVYQVWAGHDDGKSIQFNGNSLEGEDYEEYRKFLMGKIDKQNDDPASEQKEPSKSMPKDEIAEIVAVVSISESGSTPADFVPYSDVEEEDAGDDEAVDDDRVAPVDASDVSIDDDDDEPSSASSSWSNIDVSLDKSL